MPFRLLSRRDSFAICLLTCALAACSESSKSPDGGSRSDAGNGNSDAGGPDASMAVDGGGGDDAGSPGCGVDSFAEGKFGPKGGQITHCGASVAMAAGALSDERSVRLTLVALSAAPPFGLEAAGAAFEVRVTGGVPAHEPAPLSVLVPHENSGRYLHFYNYDSVTGYQGMEACTANDTVIGQDVRADGIYVALSDIESFPESRTGLGSGKVDTRFDAVSDTFDLADQSNIETYGIYDQDGSGARSITLSATKPTAGEALARLRLGFVIDQDGKTSFTDVTYGSTADIGGFWSYLPFFTGPATITLTSSSVDKLVGTFEVQLERGEEQQTLTGSFDVKVDKYRYPPELACGFVDG